MWVVAIPIALLVLGGIVALVFRKPRSHQEASPTREREPILWRNMVDAAPNAPQLDLFGWRQFYTNLLEKEQQLLRGDVVEELLSPVAWPETAQFEAVPTAPDMDDDWERSAPTRNDPNALASAPVYGSTDAELDPTTPSAPAFDEEDAHGLERLTPMTQRSVW